MTHTASDIADWFLAWAETQDADVSNLKLQKLLYYAQAHHLSETGVPLFGDDLEAWAHGPVVPSIYRKFKRYVNNPINLDKAVPDTFSWDDYRDVEKHLLGVWNTYGQYSAWALRERTHREKPWRETFDQDVRGAVIAPDSMRTFFAARRSA